MAMAGLMQYQLVFDTLHLYFNKPSFNNKVDRYRNKKICTYETPGQVFLKGFLFAIATGKKNAYNETFAYLGGRWVKKNPFFYIIKNGT